MNSHNVDIVHVRAATGDDAVYDHLLVSPSRTDHRCLPSRIEAVDEERKATCAPRAQLREEHRQDQREAKKGRRRNAYAVVLAVTHSLAGSSL